MIVCVSGDELRKALSDIEIAEKNGFEYCLSTFKVSGQPNSGNFVNEPIVYVDLFEKAHPTDPSFSWGRGQDVTKRNKFVDGKLVPMKITEEQAWDYYKQKLTEMRVSWSDGPWVEEQDYATWMQDGFHCAIRRTPITGALCGYVAVPLGHPWYGASVRSWFANAVGDEPKHPLANVDVRGGVTYAAQCQGNLVVDKDNPWWWVGFDCSHAWDVSPGMESFGFSMGDQTYKSWHWVKREVENLAQQALRATKAEKQEA